MKPMGYHYRDDYPVGKRRPREVCDLVCAQTSQNAAAFRPNGRCLRRGLRLRPTRGLRADHAQTMPEVSVWSAR
jgi:hypothetical protein